MLLLARMHNTYIAAGGDYSSERFVLASGIDKVFTVENGRPGRW